MGLEETETLGGTNKILCISGPRGREQKTKPDLPVSVWGSPAETWVSSSLPQGRGTDSSSPGRRVST